MEFNRTLPEFEKLRPNFIEDYPNAKNEMDSGFPQTFVPILQTTLLGFNHTYTLKTRRSITGLIDYMGSTPVIWMFKRQEANTSSIYAAEFSTLCT